jgi:hypothetical protein
VHGEDRADPSLIVARNPFVFHETIFILIFLKTKKNGNTQDQVHQFLQ